MTRRLYPSGVCWSETLCLSTVNAEIHYLAKVLQNDYRASARKSRTKTRTTILRRQLPEWLGLVLWAHSMRAAGKSLTFSPAVCYIHKSALFDEFAKGYQQCLGMKVCLNFSAKLHGKWRAYRLCRLNVISRIIQKSRHAFGRFEIRPAVAEPNGWLRRHNIQLPGKLSRSIARKQIRMMTRLRPKTTKYGVGASKKSGGSFMGDY